jgi:hypothetical protein
VKFGKLLEFDDEMICEKCHIVHTNVSFFPGIRVYIQPFPCRMVPASDVLHIICTAMNARCDAFMTACRTFFIYI